MYLLSSSPSVPGMVCIHCLRCSLHGDIISYYHIAGKIFLWLRLKLIRSKVLMILSERGCKNPINEVRDTQEGNQIEVVAMVSVSVDS